MQAMSDFCYATQYAPYINSLGNMSQPYLANVSIHNQRENENIAESSVSQVIPRIENLRLVNFEEFTHTNSFIRVGNHPNGLICTPVNDMIGVITGQNNNLAGKTWNNLTPERKAEIQKDLLNFQVSGIYLFFLDKYIFVCLFNY